MRENAGRSPASGVPNLLDLGVKGIYQPPDKAIESISVSGFFSFGDNPPARFTRTNYTLADDLRWTKGKAQPEFRISRRVEPRGSG